MDWDFLYHLGKEEEEDVTGGTSVIEASRGLSEATAPLEVVPALVSIEVVPPLQVLEQSIVVSSDPSLVDLYAEVKHN